MSTIKPSSTPCIWAGAVGIVALLWATMGLSQPLWLDELHSSWTIADSWTELSARAKQGNQTAAYFIGLKCLTWLFGEQQDWLTRIPSLLAWSLAVASMVWMLLQTNTTTSDDRANSKGGNNTKSALGELAIVLLCACVLLDPWQYFYAVEGRVYAIVQLLSLWAWFAVSKLLVDGSGKRVWLWIAWTVLAILSQHLHITSSLAVATQCLLLLGVLLWTGRDRLYLLASLTVVGMNTGWLLYHSQSLWQRRQQWESFAGDGSFSALFGIFPFATLLLPVILGWLIHRTIDWQQPEGIPSLPSRNKGSIFIWVVAAFAPCLLGWLVTRFDIAPIFHYRFVIASALPLYLLAGYLVVRQSSITIRCVTVLVSICWMSISYGPWASEQQGRWLNERSEDWRSAIDFVQQSYQSSPSSQSLWCYAGLIEGKGLELPISKSLSEYLSFPLRTRFRVQQNSDAVEAHGLVADRKLWLQQIREYQANFSQQLPPNPTPPAECWIIYRGTAERLSVDLVSAGISAASVSVPIRSFGNVSVVGLAIDP